MSRRSRRRAEADDQRRKLTEQRDEARKGAAGYLDTLKRKCAEVAKLHDDLTAERARADRLNADLDIARDQGERLAALTNRLDQLQQANEHLNREAVERAGTLTKVEVTA